MHSFLLSVSCFAAFSLLGQVGIGTDNPEASSILELHSETKGFLPPRHTTTERNNIQSVALGLMIYNTTNHCLEVYDGDFWNNLCSGLQSASPNDNLSVSNVSYQGQSVIDTLGIGYNGEAVPSSSTITVDLTNSAALPQNYALIATDSATGLAYSSTGTIAANAVGVPVVLTPNQVIMPTFESGVIAMTLQGASNSLSLEPRIDVKSIPTTHPDWTFNEITYGSQTYMDRNLGARRVATSQDDVFSYGNYYQWGRPADGHEITVWNGSNKTAGKSFNGGTALEDLATSDTPSTSEFIRTNATPFDWRLGNNNNRWASDDQGPCPAGYHVPSNTELTNTDAAALGSGNGTNGNSTTGWDNNLEAFESSLNLPCNGVIIRSNNLLASVGSRSQYWSSSTNGTNSRFLRVTATSSAMANNHRAFGFGVRCIKD